LAVFSGAARNWVHKKIPGCAKLCMVWQPNILNNCYELSEAMPPPEPPTRSSAPGPRWGTSVPQTPCAPTSKSWLRHWPSSYDYCFLCVIGYFVVQITVNFMPSHNCIILSDDHYSAPSRECSIVMNMSASLPRAFSPELRVQSSHFACVTRGRGPALFGGVGIRYVLALPVLQITSCLHVRREKTCTQSDSEGDRTDFTPRRILRLTQ